MHELSLANSIVEQASEAALKDGATKITSIRILLGPLAGVVQDSLEFCFSEAISETIASEAQLIIEHSPLIIKCNRCFKESEVSPHNLLCPDCKLPDMRVISGKEFRIIDLEVI